jgi:hypothetical protein
MGSGTVRNSMSPHAHIGAFGTAAINQNIWLDCLKYNPNLTLSFGGKSLARSVSGSSRKNQ